MQLSSDELYIKDKIEEIKHYLQKNGEDETFLLMKAELFYRTGEYHAAQKALLEAFQYTSMNPDIYLNLAAVSEKLHDLSLRTVYDALASRTFQALDLIEEEAVLDLAYGQKSGTEKLLYDTVKNQQPHTFIFTPAAIFCKVKQRYQNLAVALAQLGQQVIYIEPVRDVDFPFPVTEEGALSYVADHARTEEGVIIFSPVSVPASGINTYLPFISMISETKPDPVFVTSTCLIEPLASKLRKLGTLVYDCVDDHSDYANAFWSSVDSDRQFRRLEKNCDAVLTTSTSLFLQKRRDLSAPVYLSRNAVSASEIQAGIPAEIPADLASIPAPRIGYVGIIYQRFDRELFYETVKNNPDKSFVIVGTVLDNWVTRKYPNIYFLGPKDHSELHRYYKAMDICLIPYLDDAKMSVACDPVKIYEHIGCNVPTISTFMPDTAIGKPLVYHSHTVQDMQNDIDDILDSSPTLEMAEVEQFLLENSWHARAALLIRIAESRADISEQGDHIQQLLKEELGELKEYHPNFRVLYALACCPDDPDAYHRNVTAAYQELPSPFITEEYRRMKGYYEMFGNTFIDIFNPPEDLQEDAYVEIMWLNTFWCNNHCDYCHMSHDRGSGHSFDTASPRKWADCINGIKIPFILNISGGETFLDHRNFTEFYNLVVDNPRLMRIRIDTNNTIPARFLEHMNIKNTSLMTSHHPSRHTPLETIDSVNSYRNLGFDISMVNYVCDGEGTVSYTI